MGSILEHHKEVVDMAFSLNYYLASAAPFEAANAFPHSCLMRCLDFTTLPRLLVLSQRISSSEVTRLAITLARYFIREQDASSAASIKTNAAVDYCGIFLTSGYATAALRRNFP